MEIVVRGRHLTQDVGDSFRQHCQTKLERLGRLDHRLRRLDVELSHEPNPRQSGHCERVEITVRSRGPVVRAEAAAADCYAAFERAFAKLEERMRRAADRRTTSHSHSHHQHLPAPAGPDEPDAAAEIIAGVGDAPSAADVVAGLGDEILLAVAGIHELAGGLIVREKFHAPEPLGLEEAVHRMELVGHDFYLFCDEATGVPSVVYKRRGYDYGVLRLSPGPVTSQESASLHDDLTGAEREAPRLVPMRF